MWRFMGLPRVYRTISPGNHTVLLQSVHFFLTGQEFSASKKGRQFDSGFFGEMKFHTKVQGFVRRDGNDEKEEKTLALSLASLVEESSHVEERKNRSRVELKRFLELRVKRRVKEQYVNGKFQDLMLKVIANPKTLKDAYDITRVNSNVDLELERGNLPFETMAEELSYGNFDVSANTYSIATRGRDKEVLVLPNLKLRIIQEAIRIVLEVVYKPHFSKISHGGRDGRDHLSALRYIKKELSDSNWWFTLLLKQKVDDCTLNRLFSTMENKVEDPGLYAIIRSMFHAQVLNFELGGFSKGHGLPQEGVLSPILTNIYLDLFDCEVYRMSMRFEALDMQGPAEDDGTESKLRTWFRRQIHGNNNTQKSDAKEISNVRLHCCRFMDEIFVAISGSKENAIACKLDMENYLKSSLHIDVDKQIDVLPCDSPCGVRFLGTLVKRSLKDSPAVRAVHKLKEKVKLFSSQKQESWDVGTLRIGKKWLGHGLKKVKESEIKHLADSNSILSKISCFRKAGMETDHWYKILLKVWMQSINAKNAESEETILSIHIAEPALPQELVDSYYKFQKCVDDYISSETTSTLALLSSTSSSIECHSVTQIIAPVNAIKKRLHRYGLTNSAGFPRTCHMLILQDDNHIIDWFSGIVGRWLRWYKECDNFDEVKLIISDQVRLSCIRTLAAKYRIHENEIEKKFDVQLSGIPSTQEIEHEISDEAINHEDALFYGISYSGLCLLSLARKVSQSRPCNCFVIGCIDAAPSVYTLHVMEKQKFPGWKTGFASYIHPSLNRRRFGLCKQHLRDLFLGHISLQSINFGAWR